MLDVSCSELLIHVCALCLAQCLGPIQERLFKECGLIGSQYCLVGYNLGDKGDPWKVLFILELLPSSFPLLKRKAEGQGMVAYACNPSYTGGRGRSIVV
jgi:hypothetical protein